MSTYQVTYKVIIETEENNTNSIIDLAQQAMENYIKPEIRELKPETKVSHKIGYTKGPWEQRQGAIYRGDTPIAYMDREIGNGTAPVERDCNAKVIALTPELIDIAEQFLVVVSAFDLTLSNVWTVDDQSQYDRATQIMVELLNKL